METCQNLIINSDASENVAYNHPDFPAYIKKRQLSSYSDFRAVSHWHDDLEFILILDGTMVYKCKRRKNTLCKQVKVYLSTAAACIMVILVHIQNVTFSVSCYLRHFLSANTYFNQ